MRTPPTVVTVDGWDLADAGVVVEQVRGHRDAVDQETPTVELPDAGRRLRVALQPQVQARTIRVDATVLGTDMAAALAAQDELEWRCQANGLVTLGVADRTDREWRDVECESVEVDRVRPLIGQRGWRVGIVFRADDPKALETSDTVVDFAASATEAPTGTAMSEPVYRLEEVTDPVVIYRDTGGTELARMEFTVTLGAGEWIDVNARELTIVDQGGTAHPEYLTGGRFIRLDPGAADALAGPYGTLEVSPTPTVATATYRKAWR